MTRRSWRWAEREELVTMISTRRGSTGSSATTGRGRASYQVRRGATSVCSLRAVQVRGQRERWDTSAQSPHYKSSYPIRWTQTTLLHPQVTPHHHHHHHRHAHHYSGYGGHGGLESMTVAGMSPLAMMSMHEQYPWMKEKKSARKQQIQGRRLGLISAVNILPVYRFFKLFCSLGACSSVQSSC